MTQKDRILKYIKDFGSITPMDAFRDLGITKLATRVSEMKKEGIFLVKEFEKSVNRYGEAVNYMRYSMPKENINA